MTELSEHLRWLGRLVRVDYETYCGRPADAKHACELAADRIEALEAECARLREAITEAERKACERGFKDCRALIVRLLEERAAREHRLADSFKDSRQGHYRAVARQLEALAKDARKVNPAGQSHDG